jgi:hypothetical protein
VEKNYHYGISFFLNMAQGACPSRERASIQPESPMLVLMVIFFHKARCLHFLNAILLQKALRFIRVKKNAHYEIKHTLP